MGHSTRAFLGHVEVSPYHTSKGVPHARFGQWNNAVIGSKQTAEEPTNSSAYQHAGGKEREGHELQDSRKSWLQCRIR